MLDQSKAAEIPSVCIKVRATDGYVGQTDVSNDEINRAWSDHMPVVVIVHLQSDEASFVGKAVDGSDVPVDSAEGCVARSGAGSHGGL